AAVGDHLAQHLHHVLTVTLHLRGGDSRLRHRSEVVAKLMVGVDQCGTRFGDDPLIQVACDIVFDPDATDAQGPKSFKEGIVEYHSGPKQFNIGPTWMKHRRGYRHPGTNFVNTTQKHGARPRVFHRLY